MGGGDGVEQGEDAVVGEGGFVDEEASFGRISAEGVDSSDDAVGGDGDGDDLDGDGARNEEGNAEEFAAPVVFRGHIEFVAVVGPHD